MKKISSLMLVTLLLVSTFWSCKKDEYKVYLEGGTAPVLTASVTGTVPLAFANRDQQALKLSWTNPNYTFTTGISSQDVTYEVQLDTTGANFTNPKKKSINISKDLSLTLTQAELNDYLLNTLELRAGVEHNIEFRVRASLANGAAAVTSNVVKLKARPFAIPPKVDPPASGRLFMVGSATPGGWSNPVPVPAQEFTRVSNTRFELTLQLTGDGSYLFLPVNGSWDAKYGAMGANNTNNVNGDDFKAQGGDMKAPAASGRYKITVDFQTGKFNLVLL